MGLPYMFYGGTDPQGLKKARQRLKPELVCAEITRPFNPSSSVYSGEGCESLDVIGNFFSTC